MGKLSCTLATLVIMVMYAFVKMGHGIRSVVMGIQYSMITLPVSFVLTLDTLLMVT